MNQFYILSDYFENKISEKHLNKLQDFLLSGGISISSTNILSLLIIAIFTLEILLLILISIFNLNYFLLISPFLILPSLISYILIKKEQRINEIEQSSPDFLRQLSAILRVGLSFENAMESISTYGQGPLYDEIKRTILEIKMGKNFDDAWYDFVKRLDSKELKRVFIIILEGRKIGTSLSSVIEDVSNDLRDMLALKRDRKSSVMMPVMFLIISAIIATPFSLGMVSIYSNFIVSLGKSSELIKTAVIAAESYVIIHSILVGFIIGLILYGDFKKGLKFSIPLTIVAYSIFYIISNFAGSLLIF
ncbi:type II secretion system F family protein [Methanobrevibacter sp. DSM 116169]|uniref:type II secretion system F family protein n=1 Tax=Methanobrevibacter sp. DSM 116169 TaxID=3242727 RepID=UPI0038FC12B9